MSRALSVVQLIRLAPLLALLGATAGCGSFVAHRMVQAPNSYPQWLSPQARVELSFDQTRLTDFPNQFVAVGPPSATLRYRVIEPADFGFSVTATNWLKRGHPHFRFKFQAKFDGQTNAWSRQPRGTVVLLHGYGVAQFAMVPWALRLAEDGWRCVLVDLRGHGRSTGNRIFYGVEETRDLRQLLDELERTGQGCGPVTALGESYGAALALRWQAEDARIERAIAIAPYATLSNAVLNICREYAHWMPRAFPKAGLKRLPDLLKVPAAELDTATVLARRPVPALFVAGADDRISPVAEVEKLYRAAAPGSEFVVIPQASHESVTYFFNGLTTPVRDWLNRESVKSGSSTTGAGGN